MELPGRAGQKQLKLQIIFRIVKFFVCRRLYCDLKAYFYSKDVELSERIAMLPIPGGGLPILIKDNLKFSVLDLSQFSHNLIELCEIVINMGEFKLAIINIYRHIHRVCQPLPLYIGNCSISLSRIK